MTISNVEANSVLNDLSIRNRSESEKSESQADKDMFMRLLLAQIENQDPLLLYPLMRLPAVPGWSGTWHLYLPPSCLDSVCLLGS